MLRDLLKQLGITHNLRGYEYIKTAVEMIQNDNDLKHNLHGKLYPMIGRTFRVSRGSIERNICTAIEIGWQSGSNMSTWVRLFPVSEKPTNAHFLCELVEEISLKQSA